MGTKMFYLTEIGVFGARSVRLVSIRLLGIHTRLCISGIGDEEYFIEVNRFRLFN
jgi:hypothetical protein